MKTKEEIITEANRLIESVEYHIKNYIWAIDHIAYQNENTIPELVKIIIELDGRIDMLCWVLKDNKLTDEYMDMLEKYDMIKELII